METIRLREIAPPASRCHRQPLSVQSRPITPKRKHLYRSGLFSGDFATGRNVRIVALMQWFSATRASNTMALRQKERISDTNQFKLKASGTLPEHSVFVRCAAAIWWGLP